MPVLGSLLPHYIADGRQIKRKPNIKFQELLQFSLAWIPRVCRALLGDISAFIHSFGDAAETQTSQTCQLKTSQIFLFTIYIIVSYYQTIWWLFTNLSCFVRHIRTCPDIAVVYSALLLGISREHTAHDSHKVTHGWKDRKEGHLTETQASPRPIKINFLEADVCACTYLVRTESLKHQPSKAALSSHKSGTIIPIPSSRTGSKRHNVRSLQRIQFAGGPIGERLINERVLSCGHR